MTYDEFTHQSLETTQQIGSSPKVYFGIGIELGCFTVFSGNIWNTGLGS